MSTSFQQLFGYSLKRDTFLGSAKAALLLCVLAAVGDARLCVANHLNVLFIVCDDLNCDLSCYGHPLVQSPNIDKLAERGLLFQQAYCQFPLCGPSRASFLCGLYPEQTQILRNQIRIRERLPHALTLPQMFRKHRYESTRIGKLFHYNVPGAIGTDGHDDPNSWDRTFNPQGRDKLEESDVFTLKPGRHYGATLSWLAQEGTDGQQTDGIGAAHAVEFLQEYSQSHRPFFLAVGFYRPHTPYVAPQQYFQRYSEEQIVVPSIPEGYWDNLPQPARASVTYFEEQVNLDNTLAREAIRAYYASITFVDAQVGRLLDTLERTGLNDNTVVVLLSDHGYHMGEHGHYQKKTLFENSARVPLIIAVPDRLTAGQQVSCPVELLDLYPTLAELCNLPVPNHLSGKSLACVFADPHSQPREDALTQLVDSRMSGYSLRTSRYRYTEWGANGTEGIELYDHEVDAQELQNLAYDAQYEPVVSRLSKRLFERIESARRPPH